MIRRYSIEPHRVASRSEQPQTFQSCFSGSTSASLIREPYVSHFFNSGALGWATFGVAADQVSTKCPSPDGRFAMRISEPIEGESQDLKVELIRKASSEVMADLGTAIPNHVADTVLVWSADSKRVAYATRDDRDGETSVYFWNGASFDQIPLPDDPPAPDIKFRQGETG